MARRSSDYVDAEGREGFFQLKHYVYGQRRKAVPGVQDSHQAGYHRRAQQPLLPALPEVRKAAFGSWHLAISSFIPGEKSLLDAKANC